MELDEEEAGQANPRKGVVMKKQTWWLSKGSFQQEMAIEGPSKWM